MISFVSLLTTFKGSNTVFVQLDHGLKLTEIKPPRPRYTFSNSTNSLLVALTEKYNIIKKICDVNNL